MSLFSKSDNEKEAEYQRARRTMVERQITRRGVADERVLEAMATVPRHEFIPKYCRSEAYDDNPLPIGYGQTISQPYIVASMTEYLRPDASKSVLEIGTGSGYQTAILAEVFGQVETVEYVPELSKKARIVLDRLGYTKIIFHIGDGVLIPGRERQFDAIIVTAAPEKLHESFAARLKSGGRMIVPIGRFAQDLKLFVKADDGSLSETMLYPVRFVPLHH